MKNQQIKVVLYNPDWPKHFEVEAQKIKHALGDSFVDIHGTVKNIVSACGM